MNYRMRVIPVFEAVRVHKARIVFVCLVLLLAVLSLSCVVVLCRMAGEVSAQSNGNGFIRRLDYADPPQQCGTLFIRHSYLPMLAPCEIERRRLWLAGEITDDPCRAVRIADGCVSQPRAWIDYTPHPCHASTLTVFRVERPAGLYCWRDCYGWVAVTAPRRANR